MSLIVPFTAADLPGLPAFRQPGWSDIVPVFEFYLAAPYCSPVKAVRNGMTVGIGALIRLGDTTAWLGHIIVREEARRRGIGSRIVAALLEAAGCRTVSLIASEAGVSLYEKAGFTTQAEYVFLESGSARPDPGRDAAPAAPADFEALLALDRRVSGEDRRCLLEEHLPRARLVRQAGEVVAMYLPGFGEGAVLAEEPQAGLSLLAVRGDRCIGLPADNLPALAWCAANGYRETRRPRRMVRGKIFHWQPQAIFARVSGYLG